MPPVSADVSFLQGGSSHGQSCAPLKSVLTLQQSYTNKHSNTPSIPRESRAARVIAKRVNTRQQQYTREWTVWSAATRYSAQSGALENVPSSKTARPGREGAVRPKRTRASIPARHQRQAIASQRQERAGLPRRLKTQARARPPPPAATPAPRTPAAAPKRPSIPFPCYIPGQCSTALHCATRPCAAPRRAACATPPPWPAPAPPPV